MHERGTDEEITIWCMEKGGFSPLQVGDCLLDLSVDRKLQLHYDHWKKSPGVQLPRLSEITMETTGVTVVETTTVTVKQTITTVLTNTDMVLSFFKQQAGMFAVPSEIRGWVNAQYHITLSRLQVKTAIESLRKSGKLSRPSSIKTAPIINKPTKSQNNQKLTSTPQKTLPQIIHSYERKYGFQCLAPPANSKGNILWECKNKHRFWRSLVDFTKYTACPTCCAVLLSNERIVSDWSRTRQKQRGGNSRKSVRSIDLSGGQTVFPSRAPKFPPFQE